MNRDTNPLLRDIDEAVRKLDDMVAARVLHAAVRANIQTARDLLLALREDVAAGRLSGDIGAFRALSDLPFPGDMEILDRIASIERRAAERKKERVFMVDPESSKHDTLKRFGLAAAVWACTALGLVLLIPPVFSESSQRPELADAVPGLLVLALREVLRVWARQSSVPESIAYMVLWVGLAILFQERVAL
jgi:hypothetical protein